MNTGNPAAFPIIPWGLTVALFVAICACIIMSDKCDDKGNPIKRHDLEILLYSIVEMAISFVVIVIGISRIDELGPLKEIAIPIVMGSSLTILRAIMDLQKILRKFNSSKETRLIGVTTGTQNDNDSGAITSPKFGRKGKFVIAFLAIVLFGFSVVAYRTNEATDTIISRIEKLEYEEKLNESSIKAYGSMIKSVVEHLRKAEK